MKYFICRSCRIHHYVNCGTCFGFGVYNVGTEDGVIPVSAEEAHDNDLKYPVIPCPECQSTEKGVPKRKAKK